MVLSGQSIAERRIFTPFVGASLEAFGMSYGLSHCGYDVRIGDEKIKLKPGGFVLAHTYEHFSMPNDLVAMVADKSSWARRGLAVQNTVVEPGWRGYLTLELTNHSNKTIELLEGMPIAQIIFHLIDRPVFGYSGKYQDQPKMPVEAK